MPIPLSRLRQEGLTETAKLAKSMRVRKADQKKAFLCHSHRDATYVSGLMAMLSEDGWDIYVDWQDTNLPDIPDRETARAIKRRIDTADYFLFLATPASTASRWCPWEIGYADGVLPLESIFVVTTRDGGQHYGNEYLGLYRHIDLSEHGDLAAWAPGDSARGIRVAQL